MNASTNGTIITFYSYKGGTGRTMALANIACLLGQRHQSEDGSQPPRVLALDWDFEAPGLHRYFRPYLEKEAATRFDAIPGCLDLFTLFDQQRDAFHPSDYIANREGALAMLEQLDFKTYLLPTVIPGLQVMKAGLFDKKYGRRVSEFQWDRLFKKTVGLFTGFADYLRRHYDYILVDSRTGISDTSGICTMLLPDKLVVVFTPNQQSLTGIDELTRKALAYRKSSPDGRPLTVFPLPSRIEMARPALMEAWRTGSSTETTGIPADLIGYQPRFEQLFDEIYAQKDTRLKEYFDTVMLQHIPDYAFGEPIAVMLEETDSRLSLRSSYAAFAEYLTELQAPWESIAQIRMEREINRLSEEAASKIGDGDIDTALRIAYGLMERKPPASLFGPVAHAILDVAEAAYGKKRQEISKLLQLAMDRAVHADNLDPAEVAEVLTRMGDICLKAGEYTLASTALRSALHDMQTIHGEDSPAVLSVESNLAETLRYMGDLAAARTLHEKILEIRQRVLGGEHPDTLTSMNNLAATLHSLGDLQGARALQEKALEVCTRVLGGEHPDTLASMSNLASTLRSQGDLQGARDLQEKTLEVCTHVLGEEHPDTLTSMNNLAATLYSQGDLQDARSLQKKTLEVRTRILGGEHPDVLTSMNNLAEILRSQGDLQGARALQEKELAICTRIFGEEHPDTLISMNNLALTLQSQGDLQGARALQEKELAICTRILGEEHPDTLISMNNLASTLRSQGELQDARALQEKALEILTRILGGEHPETLTSMNNLASILRSQGDLQGARALQEKELAICTRVLGREHPDVLTSMSNLALTLQSQGDLQGARTLQEKVLEVITRTLGGNHPNTLTSMQNLAATLGKQGDWAGAKELQSQVLERCRQVFGEKHPKTIAAMSQLMKTAKELGDMETVVALSEELVKGVAK